MKNIFIPVILVPVICILSCKKQEVNPLGDASVTIDSFQVSSFDNLFMKASFKNIDVNIITEKGFCWGTTPTPTINDNHKGIANQLFADTMNNVGKRAHFYFRAYIKAGNAIVYSVNVSISTGALETSWQREYNNGKNRTIIQVIEDNQNGFIELLQTYNTYGNANAWPEIINYDSVGNIKWDYQYNQGENKQPGYILKLQDGYLFATTNWIPGGRGIFVTKINLNGIKLWEQSFNRKINQEFVKLTMLPNDTILLTTKAFDNIGNAGRQNCSINNFKISSTGTLFSESAVLNDNKFNQGSYAFLASGTSDNGFVVSNYYSPFNTPLITYDIILQKFNSLNQLEWEKLYGGNRDELPIKMSVTPNGNYDVLGYTLSKGPTSQSLWLFEADKNNGSQLSDFTYANLKYGNVGYTYPLGFCRTNNGQHFITGDVSEYYATLTSAFLIKVDENGKLVWEYTYTNPTGVRYSGAYATIVKSNNEIYVFGSKHNESNSTSNTLFLTKFIEY